MAKQLTLQEKLELFNHYLEHKRADEYLMVESVGFDFYDEITNEEIKLTPNNMSNITQEMFDYGFALCVKLPINQNALNKKHRKEAEENNVTSISISILIDT